MIGANCPLKQYIKSVCKSELIAHNLGAKYCLILTDWMSFFWQHTACRHLTEHSLQSGLLLAEASLFDTWLSSQCTLFHITVCLKMIKMTCTCCYSYHLHKCNSLTDIWMMRGQCWNTIEIVFRGLTRGSERATYTMVSLQFNADPSLYKPLYY